MKDLVEQNLDPPEEDGIPCTECETELHPLDLNESGMCGICQAKEDADIKKAEEESMSKHNESWKVKPHPKLRLWEIWQGLTKIAECDNEAIAKMIAFDFNNHTPMSNEELGQLEELRDTIAPIVDALERESSQNTVLKAALADTVAFVRSVIPLLELDKRLAETVARAKRIVAEYEEG